jgi:putative flavoprotein involved in K+ transport
MSILDKAQAWLSSFSVALETNDSDSLRSLFVEKCTWRDLLSFTWDIQTLEGKLSICNMVSSVLDHVKPHSWVLQEATETNAIITARIAFQTVHAKCIGHMRLCAEGCLTLLTAAQELRGYEEKRGLTRGLGGHLGAVIRPSIPAEASELGVTEQPYVVIVGGSQCGVTLGARLKRLGVPNIVLEKNDHPGDAWRHRYDSLRLHFQVAYCEFPYLSFPDHWPKYLSKDQMADWIDMYAKLMNVDIWTNSCCTQADWDEVKSTWTVNVQKNGLAVQLRPQHLVIASGLCGDPYIPKLKASGSFQGVTMHSSQYISGVSHRGKKAVVVGSGTSAHDICQDLWEHGADVTMLQRSATPIAKVSTHQDICLQPYSEEARADGLTTAEADLEYLSFPARLVLEKQTLAGAKMQAADADLLLRLERTGFLLDRDPGSTNTSNYLSSGSGTYLDVGASELIANGCIKIKTGCATAMDDSALITEDGTRLSTDLVVFATGYRPLTQVIENLIGDEKATRLGRIWGLGTDRPGDAGPWEGELRNMWKKTHVEGLWLHGGNLLQNRIYSLFLALQLKARHVCIPTLVYEPHGSRKIFEGGA